MHRGEAGRIARELALLGEPELEREELDGATQWPVGDEVAGVAAMFAAAWPEAPIDVGDAPELTAMERHRAWKRVASRAQALELVAPVHASASGGLWRVVAAGLAAAVVVALVPRFVGDAEPSQGERDRTAARGLAVQARRALDELPGERDAARARSVADAYAQRLRGAKEEG